MLRDWIPRAVLALVALASFFGGSASGSVKSALVVALVVGTVSAILLDWLAQRRRENAVQESASKLEDIASGVQRDPTGEVLRLLAQKIFLSSEGWRITLYELSDGRWFKLARAASHRAYEVSGRESFADDESFMIRFRSRNLAPGSVVIETPIKMPNRQLEPDKWLSTQAEDGRLAYAASAALTMPTRVYIFSAFRSMAAPHATLALSLESLGEDGVDEIVVQREIRAGVYESLAQLLRLRRMIEEAPVEYRVALEKLREIAR